MKTDIGNELVILGSRLSLQRTKPVIESVSRQLRAPLRGEEIRASLIMYPVLLVVIQQASCFVAWINITGLCPSPARWSHPLLVLGPTWTWQTRKSRISVTRQPTQYPRAKSAFPRRFSCATRACKM